MNFTHFTHFKTAVAQQFARMSASGPLFRTQVSGDDLWQTYLASFPIGTNPIYKTRTKHDCSCCRQFIRNVGNVVAIIDSQLVSIWDIAIDKPAYQTVANALAKLVKSKPIDNIFLTTERTVGTDKNFEDTVNGVQRWEHFFFNVPPRFVVTKNIIGPKLGEAQAAHDVLLRSLTTISNDAVNTVLDLIAQNSLYRGAEHNFTVTEFQKLKRAASLFNDVQLDRFAWQHSLAAPTSVSKIRNTSIGTLLVDLSEGIGLEDAVKKFEAMVAPENYKRPTALVTKAMIDNARKTIEGLGLTSALERRYATISDITVNNILFANHNARRRMNADVFDALSASVSSKPKNLDKVEEMTIEKFVTEILPRIESLEVLVENRHASNLMSLIAPADPTAKQLFKWPNGFSWSYNGEAADSIKERVKKAGGNVSGELCCRLAWDHEDDLDFHMYEPDGHHIYFGNRRQKSQCGGMLDLDANGCDGIRTDPSENIFYERLETMREGTYQLKVHNYTRRSNGVGFEVEIDILGAAHRIAYDKAVLRGQCINVATLYYSKARGLEIIKSLPTSRASRQVWGISTETFQPVSVLMHSPNYWDGAGVGNKHYFFMLQDCRNEGQARGFYNEFLHADLDPHRKVLEMVGSKMKTENSQDQLSGLGFSITQRNSLMVRVKGSFTRNLKLIF